MAFEITSCEIISIERHPRLHNQVRASVRVALIEAVGTHVLNLNVRVLAEEDADEDVVRQAVLGKAAHVIGRTIFAIDNPDVSAAAE